MLVSTDNKLASVIFRKNSQNEKVLKIIFKDFQNISERISIHFY